jgi:methylthioribulose-1-phosphate dehydratase
VSEHFISLEDKQKVFHELSRIKADFASRGWFPATSGNLSMRLDGGDGAGGGAFVITSSGKDKSQSTPEDFLVVNEKGRPLELTRLKPSAETLIHSEIYRLTGCGAIFHTHTIFNNIVSEMYWERQSVPIQGIELIKAFNIWDEDAEIEVPILPNYADIPKIAELIEDRIKPRVPGILLRKHGIYAWGDNAFAAKRHLEAFEFLFEYVYRWNAL